MVGVAGLSMFMDRPSLKMFQFKGLFPTMDQARIISTATFASRMGAAEDKNELLIAIPVVTIFWLFGSFLVVFVQVKNPRCPEWFLNFCELLFTVVFVGYSIIDVFTFIISGFQNFSPMICAGIVTYSSISWAHNKRTKKDD